MFKKLSKLVLSLALSLPLIFGAGSALALTIQGGNQNVNKDSIITWSCGLATGENDELGERFEIYAPNGAWIQNLVCYNTDTNNSLFSSLLSEPLPYGVYTLLEVTLGDPENINCATEEEVDHRESLQSFMDFCVPFNNEIFNLNLIPSGLPAGLWTGGQTYGGVMAAIAEPTTGIAGDMLPIAIIVIGISLGLYLLTYVIGQFKKPKDEFDTSKK
jgi:hypothetical protein